LGRKSPLEERSFPLRRRKSIGGEIREELLLKERGDHLRRKIHQRRDQSI